MEQKTRVIIVDDHVMVRAGLAQLLHTDPAIDIVGEARNGLEAIDKVAQLKPDVVLMDIYMPDMSGLEALAAIKKQFPESRVLIMTVSERDEDLWQALRSGAQGYILKSATVTEFIDSVKRTAAGDAILSPQLAGKLINGIRKDKNNNSEVPLSSREEEVLALVRDGLTNTEISRRLYISESTTRTHLQRILKKLNLRNRAEAIAYASRHNIPNRHI